MKLFTLFLLASAAVFGQTGNQINLGGNQVTGIVPAPKGGSGTTPGASLPSTPCTNGKTFVKTTASPTSAAFYACIGTAWIQQGGSLGSLTGVIKASSGTPAVVTGSASDCVFVNGTSGTCGVPVAGTGILVVGSTVSVDPSAVNTAAGTNTNTGPLFDNTAVAHTSPTHVGATPPATCTTGELAFDTAAASGQKVKGCESANTWVVQGGGLTPSGFYLTSGGNFYCGPTFQQCYPASGLTILNTNTTSSSISSSGGTQVLKSGKLAAAGDNLVMVGAAIAGGSTSLTVAFMCHSGGSTDATYISCGVGFRESATSKMLIFQSQAIKPSTGPAQVAINAYTNQTTYVSTVLNPISISPGLSLWVKLTCSVAGCATGNLTIQSSVDGVNYSQGITEAVGSHFTTSPGQWGVFGSPGGTDQDLYVDILSFRVQ